MAAKWCQVRISLLVNRRQSSHCVITWQKEQGRSLGSLIKGIHPIITSQRPPSPETITLGIGFQCLKRQGSADIQSIVPELWCLGFYCGSVLQACTTYMTDCSHLSSSWNSDCQNIAQSLRHKTDVHHKSHCQHKLSVQLADENIITLGIPCTRVVSHSPTKSRSEDRFSQESAGFEHPDLLSQSFLAHHFIIVVQVCWQITKSSGVQAYDIE